MTWAVWTHKIRRWTAKVSGTFLVGGSYGTAFAVMAKYVFELTERDALLYVGLPVSAGFAIYIWPRIGEISGFDK
jgi:hypothetical protein